MFVNYLYFDPGVYYLMISLRIGPYCEGNDAVNECAWAVPGTLDVAA